jgi:sugar phosphate isomerase/epimerase
MAAGRDDESTHALCLAQLSLIHLAPPDLVRVAADAGFDAVLARLQRTSDGRGHDVLGDPALITATKKAVADTGVRIWDTEVIRLRSDFDLRGAETLLEVSADLGASYVLTTIEDDRRTFAIDAFGGLCELAAQYQLSCSLEFMVFSKARTLDDALAILTAAGATNAVVLIDALHLFRSGGSVGEVAEAAATHPELFPYLQICDAAHARPSPDERSAREEAAYARLVPGAGTLPLTELIDAMPPGCAISVEAPPQQGADIDAIDFARLCFDGAQRVLDRG